MMAYKAEQVANYFIEKARAEGKGEEMTPMKVLKLVYIAHGWYLALMSGKPLINDKIEAWKYGPVIPVIYQRVKRYGAGSIQDYLEVPDKQNLSRTISQEDNATVEFLDRIWEVYGRFSGLQLSSMTHDDETPWQEVIDESPHSMNPQISDEVIKSHYEKRVAGRV